MVLRVVIKKHILLAVCGGIAAYKSAELVRCLIKKDYEVRVIMTASACQFITPLTFQALSGHPVQTQCLDAEQENAMGHINLARWADNMIIAPATANIIAKLAHGLADDLVSTLCLAAECPVYIAPAMNQAMWHKPVTQNNLNTLKDNGFTLISPEKGTLACGEWGWGRMSDPSTICDVLIKTSIPSNPYLNGVHLLISAGPTREALDPVRYMTNRSSGKMGYALAQASIDAGAKVTLISGPVTLPPPLGVTLITVETAEEMFQAVVLAAKNHQIYIGAAAVADYTFETHAKKIKKQPSHLSLTLHKTKDILAHVALLPQRPFVVGFAAETHDLTRYAHEKLIHKKLDMIAANWVGKAVGGFDDSQNALQVFWKNGGAELPMMDKKDLAVKLMTLIFTRYQKKTLE
ncbi:MAG: bifunctional phosphopantothenoylcysteine decarboxylase/phosphopantothenate--cysteine ligase CoaBC [Methylococcales bacterium]|nr:bifunctional phosphopantothenoylcysteine decarboxylase/phosphopantothenate--cysteine ligase CoaBC [Methylococcales bacterium]